MKDLGKRLNINHVGSTVPGQAADTPHHKVAGVCFRLTFPNQQVQVILGETTGGGQEGVKESEEEANPHQSFPQLTEQLQNSIAGLCTRLFGQV